jgi:quinol monooxygenase YgiN
MTLTLPWIHGPAPASPSPTDRTVMTSRLELRRLRHVPAFLIASLQLRHAIRQAPGAIGLGLRARPLARTFWTLSAWTDHEALQTYNHSPLHRGIVERFRPHMAGSTFRFYTAPAGTRPGWDDALRRLDKSSGPERPAAQRRPGKAA